MVTMETKIAIVMAVIRSGYVLCGCNVVSLFGCGSGPFNNNEVSSLRAIKKKKK